MLMPVIYRYFYLIRGIIIWTVSVWMRIIFYALRRSFPRDSPDRSRSGVRIIFAFSTFIAALCVSVCYSAVRRLLSRGENDEQDKNYGICGREQQNRISHYAPLFSCHEEILYAGSSSKKRHLKWKRGERHIHTVGTNTTITFTKSSASGRRTHAV